MSPRVIWSRRALNGLEKVISYLREVWTEKEIVSLERRIDKVLGQLRNQPEMYPTSSKKPELRKAVIDKNNYMIYRWNPVENQIIVIVFRGTRQKPVL